MRLCRFGPESHPELGFYDERRIIPLRVAAEVFPAATGRTVSLPASTDLLDFLPPDGPGFDAARELAAWAARADLPGATLDPAKVQLLVPVPRPNKIFLLAGNYADHIREGGGIAADPKPEPPAPEPEGDVESVRGDIQVLKIGQPIKAYHVQASATVDFRKPLFDRYYDEGDRFIPSETGLAPGNYWWRIAAVDLLGVEAAFRPAHYYSLGLNKADPDEERLASSLTIMTPENNDQIGGEVARATGILRDQRLTLHINGVPVNINDDGTFAITVRVRYGRTAVIFTLTDPKGNQAHVARYVMKL